jgi:type IV pilus assembly protein PilW
MVDSLTLALYARQRGPGRPRRHLGFTLVELMVALTVGLFLVTGLMTIYLQTGNSNNELAKLNRQMESARFALQLLREDLWHAGFWGEYSPPRVDNSTAPPTPLPTHIPDPCAAFSSWDDYDTIDGNTLTDRYIKNFLSLPVYGYNNADPAGCAGVVTDRKAGTDVLVVRHVSTCLADTGTDNNCENFGENKLYLQVNLCSDPDPSTPPNYDSRDYVMDTDPDEDDQTPFILARRDPATGKSCGTSGYPEPPIYAGKRKVISHIYYVKDDNTLRRSELDYNSGASEVQQQSAQALIEGIEHMEVEYGVDADGDGSVDSFTSAPADVAAWGNVVAVKVHLLARALEATPGHTDTKTYQLGATSLGPFWDGFNRHVYSTYVRLNNPAGRRDEL